MFEKILFAVALSVLLGSSVATASIFWSVEMTSPSGGPGMGSCGLEELSDGCLLGFVSWGDRIALDITLRSDGERVVALGGSVYGYDPQAITLAPGSVTSTSILSVLSFDPGQGIGGLYST